MTLQQTLTAIRDGDIHGSDTIARNILLEIADYARRIDVKTVKQLERRLDKVRKQIRALNQPVLDNALTLLTVSGTSAEEARRDIGRQCEDLLAILDHMKALTTKYGGAKARQASYIFTHSYSTTVARILKAASIASSFRVATVETQPFHEGRRMAEELAEYGIQIQHYLDNGFRPGLRKSDFVLLGAEAMTDRGAILRVGAGLIAEIARMHKLPVYICVNGWKYKKGYTVNNKDIITPWRDHSKNVSTATEVVERLPYQYIKGVICEFGILKPEEFLLRIKKEYPFLT